MNKRNFKLSHVGAVVLLTAAGSAAAETLTVPATVAVDNTINFTVTGSLDFGILRANADNSAVTTCVGLTVPADPAGAVSSTLGTDGTAACTTGAGNAVIQNVGGTITRPEFAVAGLAPFTGLTLNLPASGGSMALATPPPGASEFQLMDFTAYQTSGTPGAVTTTVTADASGDIAFTVGATIITDPGNTATADYENSTYAGSFDVEVTF